MNRLLILNAILIVAMASTSAEAGKKHRKGTAKKKIEGVTLKSVDVSPNAGGATSMTSNEIPMMKADVQKAVTETKVAAKEAADLRKELIANDDPKAVGAKSDVKAGANADHSGMKTENIDKKGVLITANNVDLMTDAKTKTSLYDGKVAPEATKFLTEDGAQISISQAAPGQRLVMITPDGTRHPGVKTAAGDTANTLDTSKNYSDPRYSATQLFPGVRVGQGKGAVSGFTPDEFVGLFRWKLQGQQLGYYSATDGMLALMRQIGSRAGASTLLFKTTSQNEDDLFGGGGGGEEAQAGADGGKNPKAGK